MLRFLRFLAIGALAAWIIVPGVASASPQAFMGRAHASHPEPPQETGFLNRKLELHGVTYRYQVYLPEEWRRDDHKQWPVILFLHGRGERGSEGMWQTQIGLPQAIRDHPERWPFIVVMPQCPLSGFWTDQEMLAMAIGVTRNLVGASRQGLADITDIDDERYLLGKGERATISQMIDSFTANGAYAMFLEGETGSIETDKRADLDVDEEVRSWAVQKRWFFVLNKADREDPHDLADIRADFDRRLRDGRFAPPRRRVVTATEITGLLKTWHGELEHRRRQNVSLHL